MQRILVFFSFLFLIVVSCKDDDKKTQEQKPVQSHYSAEFNRSVDSVMLAYYSLTEAFVNWDSIGVNNKASDLEKKLQQLLINKEKDTVSKKASEMLNETQSKIHTIEISSHLVDKRHGLNDLTENLFSFLNAIHYDEKKLYLQKCPMAFNDVEPGVWLSEKDTIRNPYMGLHHPTYGKAMIECGENKSVIDFTQKEK